jgi:hypothetical protein
MNKLSSCPFAPVISPGEILVVKLKGDGKWGGSVAGLLCFPRLFLLKGLNQVIQAFAFRDGEKIQPGNCYGGY